MAVDYKPRDYHTVTPYLIVDGAEELITFMREVLDATELMRLPGPDGRLGHVEMRVGDSVVMLADVPRDGSPSPATLHLYLPNADETYRRGLARGATSIREPRTEFYGDRMAGVQDRFGNRWYFATHVEDVSEEDMSIRAAELAATAS